MVPRILWETSLPFAAKGVAAYLFCLRDGAVPYVAEIEAALGLGRDARRKAFAALEAAGVIEWHIERNARQGIVGKSLVLHPENIRAPESQADGKNTALGGRAPENPEDGISAPAGVEVHPCGDGKSGDTLKERKKERVAVARSGIAARSASPRSDATRAATGRGGEGAQAPNLTAFQRARVLSGQSCLLDGVPVLPGSPAFDALRQALRGEDAEKGGKTYAA